VHGCHSYHVKETIGFSLDPVSAHTSILFCTAERLNTPNPTKLQLGGAIPIISMF